MYSNCESDIGGTLVKEYNGGVDKENYVRAVWLIFDAADMVSTINSRRIIPTWI